MGRLVREHHLFDGHQTNGSAAHKGPQNSETNGEAVWHSPETIDATKAVLAAMW
jgi:hypothetical protein